MAAIRVPRPEADLRPRLVQRAFLTLRDFFVEGDELLPPRLRRPAQGFSPAARRLRDSVIRSVRAATFSRLRDSSDRTAAPRGIRPGGDTVEINRRVAPDPHAGQSAAPTEAATSSSKRSPQSSHSNS